MWRKVNNIDVSYLVYSELIKFGLKEEIDLKDTNKY